MTQAEESAQERAQKDSVSTISALLVCIWVFLLGGIVGWLYETFICAPLNGVEVDWGHGGLGLPFLHIYGIGAVLMELAFGLNRPQKNPVLQLLLCMVLCTAVEWVGGAAMLYGMGVQTWDYHMPGWDFLVTPDGLICLRASLTFGIFGLLQLRFFSPAFWKLWEATSDQSTRRIFAVALVLAFAVVILAMLNAYVLNIVDVGNPYR